MNQGAKSNKKNVFTCHATVTNGGMYGYKKHCNFHTLTTTNELYTTTRYKQSAGLLSLQANHRDNAKMSHTSYNNNFKNLRHLFKSFFSDNGDIYLITETSQSTKRIQLCTELNRATKLQIQANKILTLHKQEKSESQQILQT